MTRQLKGIQILNSNVLNFVWNLGHWKLDIVSNLDIRISDLSEQ
jgi:hypothetical protein